MNGRGLVEMVVCQTRKYSVLIARISIWLSVAVVHFSTCDACRYDI